VTPIWLLEGYLSQAHPLKRHKSEGAKFLEEFRPFCPNFRRSGFGYQIAAGFSQTVQELQVAPPSWTFMSRLAVRTC
jgi:hypothetical protein